MGGMYVTHEGVDKYGGRSGRHEYNRRDIIKLLGPELFFLF
jgi:hypothetical protein